MFEFKGSNRNEQDVQVDIYKGRSRGLIIILGGIWNFCMLFVISLFIMGAMVFTFLNSLEAFPGSITSVVTGVSGAIILLLPSLTISTISSFVSTRWKLLNKGLSVLLVIAILLSSIFLVALPIAGYLGPNICPSSFYPSYPAFLAGNKYISSQALYQKIVGCKSNGDWSSLTNKESQKGRDTSTACKFLSNGTYQVIATPGKGPFGDGVQPCFFRQLFGSNFAYQVDMVVVNQDNLGGGGLVFRATNPPDTINSNSQAEQTMYRTVINVTGYDPKKEPPHRSYNFFLLRMNRAI